MSRTLQEYHARWQQTMQQWDLREIVEEPDLTNESCVVFESARSTPMGEGMIAFPDFCDAICYYRLPEELDPPDPQGQNRAQRRSRLTHDELRVRLAAAREVLDSLLGEFIQQGYRAEMSKRLQEIVNQSLIDFELHEVYGYHTKFCIMIHHRRAWKPGLD